MQQQPLVTFIAVLLGLLFAIADAQQSDDALRCKDHPAYSNALNSVLISSWDYDVSSPNSEQLAYIARYSGHVYAPVSDPASNKFRGLDLFHTTGLVRSPSFRMTFQRGAIAYIFVDVESDKFDPSIVAMLRGGWTSEGWAERIQGANTITYGIHDTLTRPMTKYAYVFSKTTGSKDFVDFPQGRFVKQRITGLAVPGSFNVWVAEADGSASPPVGAFGGSAISANSKCPDALHNVWTTQDNNPNDPDTQGVEFRTWHPAWDPCFWCAYDHEHGSSPTMLMNYTPKFTYTSWKNNREMESDRGFKGFVLRSGPYLLYYSLHVAQSSLRRVSVRFHTINFAVVDRKTKELLMDIQHKGDFGWAGVRLLGGKTFRAINPAEAVIEQELLSGPNNFRSINIIAENSPNPEFFFRSQILIGAYEEWQTLPMCMQTSSRTSIFHVVLKLPNTAFKSLAEPNTIVNLGKKTRGRFYRSTGLNRSLRFRRLNIGAQHCPEGAAGGFFYTDQFGKEIRSGPGPNSVRQFVKPGFNFVLNGRYEAVDTWTGLHFKGARGFFSDHGYGIDPDRN